MPRHVALRMIVQLPRRRAMPTLAMTKSTQRPMPLPVLKVTAMASANASTEVNAASTANAGADAVADNQVS